MAANWTGFRTGVSKSENNVLLCLPFVVRFVIKYIFAIIVVSFKFVYNKPGITSNYIRFIAMLITVRVHKY